MARAAGYGILVAIVFLALLASARLSMQSESCMACHRQEAEFVQWMEQRLKAEKRGFSHELIACAACHFRGGPEGSLRAGWQSLLHTAMYLVPQIDPRRPMVTRMFKTTHLPSENCRYCHEASIVRKTVWVQDLPQQLVQIGLAMDHRKHVLASEDTCAQCHERYKAKGEADADKTVNYAEVNHLSCGSCHTTASHAYRSDRLLPLSETDFYEARREAWRKLARNPRWMVAFPTEETCRRCHNGKIHYKTRIFLADRRTDNNFENCIKCHPLMTRDYFEEFKRKRVENRVTSNGKSPARKQVRVSEGIVPVSTAEDQGPDHRSGNGAGNRLAGAEGSKDWTH